MTTGFLGGLLRQIRSEGVENIRFIHFEGRGDPLVNARLPDLIELSKLHFPSSLVGITTHCSYPYMPWIVRSGLDVLRASIDGAKPESYSKYRVGGNFERVMAFLSQLRDDRIRTHSALRVEWKYILFEWNDSHSEMQRAVELAKELQVHLTFVRTHSPGRSLQFQSDDQLREYVRQFAPCSAMETTFQLRHSSGAAAPNAVIAEHVAALLSLAVERFRSGDTSAGFRRLVEALRHDPEITVTERGSVSMILRKFLPQILADAKFPSTLTWLAALSREVGDNEASDELLSRYLELAPDAPDRKHILSDRLIRSAVQHADKNQLGLARADLRQAVHLKLDIAPDSGESENPLVVYLDRVLKADAFPSLALGFACVALAEKSFKSALALFRKYLELVPDASDRGRVEKVIADLETHMRRNGRYFTV